MYPMSWWIFSLILSCYYYNVQNHTTSRMETMLWISEAPDYKAVEALYFSKFLSLNIILNCTTMWIVTIFKTIRTGHESVLSRDFRFKTWLVICVWKVRRFLSISWWLSPLTAAQSPLTSLPLDEINPSLAGMLLAMTRTDSTLLLSLQI